MINISLSKMIDELKESIVNQTQAPTYYYKRENEYIEITEVDLMRGRFITIDCDFSEYEWELKESSIYREAIGVEDEKV